MNKTILAIGAHPDDIEIGCGGTISALQKNGYTLINLVVTSGEEGSMVGSRKEIIKNRELEAKKSGSILGASKVIFLWQSDGLTTYSKELKMQLVALIRKYRPDIVFTHAKSDKFPDHQVVHQLTMSAILISGGPWYPDAIGPCHTVNDVYGYEVWNPITEHQLSFNITTTLNQKIKALQQHTSQLTDVNYIEAVKGLARYRGTMTMTGEFAEVFEVLKLGVLA
jgi:LmbE family N-acetylglucosaminyl deacetylase